jgi:diacylglycerol kinase family enzyme
MYIPRLTMGLMRTGSHLKYKHTLYEHDVKAARLVSADRPFPIQVDGEFVGDRTSLDVELVEDGLTLLT